MKKLFLLMTVLPFGGPFSPIWAQDSSLPANNPSAWRVMPPRHQTGPKNIVNRSKAYPLKVQTKGIKPGDKTKEHFYSLTQKNPKASSKINQPLPKATWGVVGGKPVTAWAPGKMKTYSTLYQDSHN
jgi:hypothetical protein